MAIKKLSKGTRKRISVPVKVVEDYGTGFVGVNVELFENQPAVFVIMKRSILK